MVQSRNTQPSPLTTIFLSIHMEPHIDAEVDSARPAPSPLARVGPWSKSPGLRRGFFLLGE